MELLFGKSKNAQKTRKTILLVSLPLLLLGLIPSYCYKPSSKQPQTTSKMSSNNLTPSYQREDVSVKVEELENCDVFTGEWIPNSEAPYYTNKTCWAIHEHQNCIKYGRPDLDFMKWRWKPDGCDLPIFNPYQFLDIVRGKSLAFVGDSVGRNQLQSLICMLSRVSSISRPYNDIEHLIRDKEVDFQ
ncbi:hypothetical protein LIER_13662 [Lithospermum erythrorhizon]|uniref:Trichome birefringence-like N-terminal domain-containing protein n=1 Tax=Lithospermum erythrorhizon TaxID=34254 RepID=A0AAV3PYG3_LITER